MKRHYLTIPATLAAFTAFLLSFQVRSQCDVTATASSYEIYCGESVDLTAFGQSSGTVVLNEDFNTGGFGTGWSSTPGATSFTNPCSPGGVDGTTHAWMDNNTSVPRTLESASYDLTAATAGVTICFDLLFASQGGASPCEGPDEPDEGVYLEYSTDGGATWQTIHYFDPNGGNDPLLTNWNNWCFQVPNGAITANTMFRWHQTADSGADYDHWGIDNVEIYQNDNNAELEWLHDGYSYGVGNPGGMNPNSVSPTTTTTYTAQLTTGNGTICTGDVTVNVIDPNFDVNLTASPNPICLGDCAQINGNADVIYDPGGPTTYENNELAPIIGSPAIPFLNPVGNVSSDMNINVTGINQPTVTNGLITSICINQYAINAIGGGGVDLSNLEIILECPGGTSVTLANVGDLSGNFISNLCFELGAPPLSSGSAPYSGTFAPAQSWAGLNGCSSNGVWNLLIQGDHNDLSLPIGALTGWLINFDNPPDIQTPTYSWNPITDLSDPSIFNPEACPTATTTYTLTVSNGVPGCAVHNEDITITVDPCNCTPPNTIINNPITACNPNTVDLNTAIDAASDPANYTFYNTQTDAQNAINAIGSNVATGGSYWVRAEDPNDPTCFLEYEIQVVVTTVTYSASNTDENCGSADGVIDLTANGGTAPYSFSIDNGNTTQATGTFNNLTAGSYDIIITDDQGCEVTGTEVVGNIGGPTITSVNVTDPTCAGDCDGSLEVVVTGGTAPYTYQWLDNGGAPIGPNVAIINGLCADDYSIEVTDASPGGCVVVDNATLTDPALEDPSFTFADFCEGSANGPTITGDAGGTFAFNPVPTDGATINGATGEISNGVNGATYTVEYTTGGPCPESLTQTTTVTGFTFTSSVVDENCGNLDGEITLTPNGGTAPYTYSIDNGNTTQNNATFTGQSAGAYNVLITDDNGCTATGQVSVANIGGPTIDQLNTTDPSCPATCDGEMEVVVSGGTPPYTYSWTDINGNSVGGNTATITGLCAGDYTIEVTDAGGVTSTIINSNTSFENAPGGGCNCANNYNCGNDAGQVVDGTNPVYQVGDQGCMSSTTNYTNSLGANSGSAYMYFYAGLDQISTGPFTFVGGETIELCVFYAGPQGAGPPGQNTANSHFSFGIDGVQVGPDVTVATNQGWTQFCFTVTMTAGNHTFEILSGGAAQYSMWFDDFTITEQTSGGGATCPVTSTGTLVDPLPADATFALTDFCEGTANNASGILTPGGTFAFNPAPGDGSTIDAATGEITSGVGGSTYTVEYTTPAPCPVTSTETVTVIAGPQFTVSGVDPSCGAADGEITIEGLQANTAYDLIYDDNGTITASQSLTTDGNGQIIVSGLAAGTYTDFEITLNGCTTTVNTVINLVQAGAPNVTAPNDIEGCLGLDITLTANNPDGATISWDNGVIDGVPFSGSTVGTTTYTVTGDLNGCSVTDQVDVIINPLPTVDAGADQTICEGESITLSGSGAQNYQWDNGVVDGTSFTPSTTTTYTVTGTDANGCQNVDQVTVTIEPAPVVAFNGDELAGCYPHTVNFNNTTVDGTNCTWDFGDGTTGSGCSGVSHTYTSSGLYTVTLTVENASGCVSSRTFTNYIEVTGPPIADFTADPMVTDITDPEVNFTNESVGGNDFTWNFDDGSGSVSTYDATHMFPEDEPGDYIVTLVASNGPDCADTARLLIRVEDVILFYVPNTFTPDGDGFNPTFQPVFTSGYDPQDFQLLIFNRWGEVIFESRDASIGWDGTYNGQLVKDGTYIWTIEFQETMSDQRHYHQGHVNMLK
jgi:gliding motility-associated-like protein